MQCDGTSVINFLERAGGKRPGCWAHGRRRLVACARSGDALAYVPLRILRRLFAVERLSAMLDETADERLRRRCEYSAPALEELRAWLDEQHKVHPPKTPLGNAIGYLLRQWHRLVLFLTDGRIELTNNRVERELRSLVLGRKNWLFAYGDLGGERTATILTLVGTCIAHQLNPRAYLHVVTKLIVHGWPQARIRELLPDQIGKLHPELRLPARTARTPALPAPSQRRTSSLRARSESVDRDVEVRAHPREQVAPAPRRVASVSCSISVYVASNSSTMATTSRPGTSGAGCARAITARSGRMGVVALHSTTRPPNPTGGLRHLATCFA